MKKINRHNISLFLTKLANHIDIQDKEIDSTTSLKIRNDKLLEDSHKKLNDSSSKDISILNKDECTGCGACFNICPVSAITMMADKEGFLYPNINNSICIHCGKCKDACPSLNLKYTNDNNPVCYATMADDSIRSGSSSGGMFTLLAEEFLKENGAVCGAVMNEDFSVVHKLAYCENDILPMRGSKYVQSDTGLTYHSIKELLKKGTKVMFTGCPCQIAGLYGYLGKDYENLLTVDLICHGVPSPKVLKKYIEETYLEKGKKIKSISFRDKQFWGWSSHMHVFFQDGTCSMQRCSLDSYYRAFLPCMSMRPSCPKCKFTTLPRQADISIGDFWGIEKYEPELNDGKGTSLVLINSQKGASYFQRIIQKFYRFKEMDINQARPRNYTIDHPFKKHIFRDRFFRLLDKYPFEKAVNYGITNHYDVGLVGLWYGENYGSMITYYSLYSILNEIGLTVLLISNPLKSNGSPESEPEKFARMYGDISRHRSLSEMRDLNNFCDSFLLGSDQLWNYSLSRPYGQMYFLNFVDDNKKKIAYATSFGLDEYKGPQNYQKLAIQNIKRFDKISVREVSGVKICREIFDVDAVKTLDPVFLCPRKYYDKLADQVQDEVTDKRFILAYILDPSTEKRDILRSLAKELQLPVYVLLDEPKFKRQSNIEKFEFEDSDKAVIFVQDYVTVSSWLKWIRSSSFVITDSFHGACFSIIYGKQFIAIPNERRGKSRIQSLLSTFGMDSQLLDTPIGESNDYFKPINYKQVYEKIEKEKEFSNQWLKDALFSTKSVKNFTSYPIIDERLENHF